ncbi:hypothetical protein TSOC_003001 [Tetrabaena socialis]|uniref:RZ-type domain-containing protein n=1 Tax=Tetrabaena socialis TaxID=47790 RepID=A0A2J8ACQ7_9CHLO|nr:hypothetical protein TSOC_003001 [Tetrabaena socialis]|eukprot:PNH10293.1 hypothetical protein TSOC_003001 [Tetrabaena socialis]
MVALLKGSSRFITLPDSSWTRSTCGGCTRRGRAAPPAHPGGPAAPGRTLPRHGLLRCDSGSGVRVRGRQGPPAAAWHAWGLRERGRCSNGHLYIVDGCGRPYDRASCPVCGVPIGWGSGDRPAEDFRI